MGKRQVPGDSNNNVERDVEIFAHVTAYEHEYMETMASILSKIDINGNKILKTNSIPELIRTCITYTCGIYQMQVFPDSSIVTRLPDKESVKEFIAFRKKYMNFPIQAQLDDLKRLGIVKQKTGQRPQQATA